MSNIAKTPAAVRPSNPELETNYHDELSTLFEDGHEVLGVERDQFMLEGLDVKMDRVRLSYDGLLNVEVRRPSLRPDVSRTWVTLMSGASAVRLAVEYEDGHEALLRGGTFAVDPDGTFVNKFTFSPRGHGPLTQETERNLMDIASGKVASL